MIAAWIGVIVLVLTGHLLWAFILAFLAISME